MLLVLVLSESAGFKPAINARCLDIQRLAAFAHRLSILSRIILFLDAELTSFSLKIKMGICCVELENTCAYPATQPLEKETRVSLKGNRG